MTQEPATDRPAASSELEELLMPIDIESVDPDSAVVYRMLYEHSQAALSYTQLLYDLSRRLVGAYHLNEVLDVLCAGVKTALNADTVFVLLVDAERQVTQEVWFDAQHQDWLHQPRHGDTFKDIWASVIGRAIRTRTAVLSPKQDIDLSESPRVRILRKRTFGLCAIAVTPMRFQQRVVGAVVAINQYPKRDFNSFDVDLITTFADQAALVVENARLQAEMAARSVQLAQQAEELARSNAELERFAYVASHDLQEPLRVVSSYVELFLRRYGAELPDEGEIYLGFVLDGVERMRQLIKDLLAYSRVDTLGRAPVKVSSQIVFAAAQARLAALIAETDAVITVDPLPDVLADETQLEQLFQNLLSNALKFRRAVTPLIHVYAQRKDKVWYFCVKDNGIGIDVEQSDRIFKIFQRLHTREEYPGTGIGLAICKRIVERHGGRIWLESVPGVGSTFYFSLPAVE